MSRRLESPPRSYHNRSPRLESFMPKVLGSSYNLRSPNSQISIGLHVFATARNKDSILDLEAMGMDTLSLEVTSQKSIAEAKEEITQRAGGSLDYLVNNALVPSSKSSSITPPLSLTPQP